MLSSSGENISLRSQVLMIMASQSNVFLMEFVLLVFPPFLPLNVFPFFSPLHLTFNLAH